MKYPANTENNIVIYVKFDIKKHNITTMTTSPFFILLLNRKSGFTASQIGRAHV